MGRLCSICSHPQRAAIDVAVVSGQSFRRIATQFQTSEASIRRHTADHISEALRASQGANKEAQALEVAKQLQAINTATWAIVNKALAEGNDRVALLAADRVLRQLELQAKIQGDIDTPQVNIRLTEEWRAILDTITGALDNFPEAKIAVATALMDEHERQARLN
ncbi:hypothetical protein [Ktedonospora formicarum]|uniref:Uncharacterized protein n=1 Tax=Ktedonospora formicarum TaxID=2778364 RepID=A0A8J3IEW5_9CHLR|nr:hypothetical protein [Ktedonospora formicarum]GHO51502.1 hypothetical protein KSX_96650 [Ktedonospora formicarum]